VSGGRWRALAWPASVCAITGLHVVVVTLLNREFLIHGDTDAQFAPTWYHLGELVRGGQWPPLLDPDSWAGGNYAAEALFGVYNPVNVLIWVFMSLVPNLLVGVVVVKGVALMALALGTWMVCRDHGAERWSAAVVSIALPVSGYTLYWDAGSWAAGLLAFAYAPWIWWSFRRVLQRRLNPFWAFLIGSLAVTQGNPYGTLAVAGIGFALLVEGAVARNWRGARTLLLLGICVAAWLPLVYLPLLETADLAVRSGGLLFSNNGKMRPAFGDLFGLGSPTYVPPIRAITGPMQVPAVYFAWFLVPLLPWLRYAAVRGRARELVGVGTLAAFYLLLAVGPSKLWLFRWPIRQVEYFYLALAVALAVLLGHGLARDHVRARLAGTVVLVGLTAWLTWSEDPAWTSVAIGGPLVLVLLTVALLGVHLRRLGGLVLTGLLIGSTTAVLVVQALVFNENASSRVWHFPHDVSTLQHRFAERDGTVIQFADLRSRQKPGHDAKLRESWRDFLAGSMYDVADVDAVNHYTGMGYLPFTRRLCMDYDGLTKSCGYQHIWEPVTEGGPPLADLMKIDTVVVQKSMAPTVTPPDGWSVAKGRNAWEFHRDEPLSEGSHLSWADDGVEIGDASTDGAYAESVDVSSETGGELVFAMLAWPGYSAEIDGESVPLSANDVGLVTVRVPPGTEGTLEVTYRPPGLAAGLAAGALGALGAVALGVLHRRRRRRGERPVTAAAGAGAE
jgi:hypothetical protein